MVIQKTYHVGIITSQIIGILKMGLLWVRVFLGVRFLVSCMYWIMWNISHFEHLFMSVLVLRLSNCRAINRYVLWKNFWLQVLRIRYIHIQVCTWGNNKLQGPESKLYYWVYHMIKIAIKLVCPHFPSIEKTKLGFIMISRNETTINVGFILFYQNVRW